MSPQVLVRLISNNIRFAIEEPYEGEVVWDDRKHLIISQLLFHTRYCPESFIGLQEALHHQLDDVLAGLNSTLDEPDWASIGVGRDDGAQKGEMSPLLYRQSVWKLVSFEPLWLSKTPSAAGSVGWDAVLPRVLTVGLFEHRATGKRVLGLNTHFDHKGVEARRRSGELVVATANRYVKDHGVRAMFLSGDFNSTPEEEGYKAIAEGEGSVWEDVSARLDGPRNIARYGHQKTFTGFGHESWIKEPLVIDFLFVGPKDKVVTAGEKSLDEQWVWKIEGFGVLENRFDDEVYNSDHRALVADLTLGGA